MKIAPVCHQPLVFLLFQSPFLPRRGIHVIFENLTHFLKPSYQKNGSVVCGESFPFTLALGLDSIKKNNKIGK